LVLPKSETQKLVGRSNNGITWPDNAKICVTFIIPWEVWPEDFGTSKSQQRSSGHHIPPPNARFKVSMSALTERQYGDRVGVWRLLDLFDRKDVKVTFLMNGRKVELFPDATRNIKEKGHELSSEGYVHEYSFMMTRAQEQASIKKTVSAFENVTGEKPTGYLSPGHAYTDNTLDLVTKAGYTWWADPLDYDLPYILKSSSGKKIVVIPYNLPGTHDYLTYAFNVPPRELLQIWRDQFDYLYAEGGRGTPKFMALNLHPFVSGKPYVAKVVEEFIDFIKEQPKVWIAKRIEIAKWWLDQGYD
jgi:allantoinase